MNAGGPGLVSRVSQLRPWWQISEWGLVQRFSFCRHSAHRLRGWERKWRKKRVCCLWLYLTLVTLSWFLYIPQICSFLLLLLGEFIIFILQFQDIFSICFSVWVTHNVSKGQKQIWLFLHEWLTRLGSSELFSLSLSYVCFFHLSLSVCLYLASL